MLRWIKQLFKIYEEGYEYWVNTSEIKISPEFSAHHIYWKKLKSKKEYYYRTGNFESPIILNKDFILVDGYSSYIIGAKIMKMDKLPVYFKKDASDA